MAVCLFCRGHSGCCGPVAKWVTEEEARNPHFQFDVRKKLSEMGLRRDPDVCLDHFVNFVRDWPGIFIDGDKERCPEFDIFYPLDDVIMAPGGALQRHKECMRSWWKHVLTPPREGVVLRLRRESRMRFIIIATVLRAMYPAQALLWGVRPANDNRGPANDNREQE